MRLGRPGLSPVMVGRAGALALLAHAIPSGDGEPALVVVTGEAGIGKTRLLREFLTTLPAGAVVLAGGADPGSLGRPYEVMASALGHPVAEDAGAAEVAAMVRGRTGAGLGVVVLDDLHWADAESVAVIERLAQVDGPPLVLVGSYRPDELTRRAPFGDLLLRLERRRPVQHVPLQRFAMPDVHAFVAAVHGRAVPNRVAASLWERTGGNPFFLEELLLSAGDVPVERLAELPLPWTLAEIVRDELDGLSGADRRVVEAAAVLGRGATFDVLAAVTRLDEAALVACLRGLVDRGLLLEAGEDRFEFRHALVRDAVQQGLLGRERRRLHEDCLAALRQGCCTDFADLARHAAGAGRWDELVALAREGVAHYLARGSSYQALRLAELALAECDDDVALLAGAARAAWLVGLYDEALAYARRWEDVAADDEGRAGAVRMQSRLHWERSDEPARRACEESLVALSQRLPRGEERAAVLAAVAQAAMLSARYDEAVEWADRAVAAADEVGAKSVRAQALVEKGSALLNQGGDPAAGREVLLAAIAEAEAVGDMVQVTRGLNNLRVETSIHGAEGRELMARWREAAERTGFDLVAGGRWGQALVEMALSEGDLVSARLQLARAAELALPERYDAVSFPVIEAQVAMAEGDLDAAGRAIDEARRRFAALEVTDANCPDHPLTWAAHMALVLAGARGEPGQVRAAWAEFRGLPRAFNRCWAESVLPVVQAVLAAGVDPAEVRGALGACADWPFIAASPWAPAIEAHFALAAGDAARARTLYAQVTSLPDGAAEVPAPLLAELEQAQANLAEAAGDVDGARVLLQSARARLARWPGPQRRSVDADLERLAGAGGGPPGGAAPADAGAGARRDALRPPGGELTAREREVAGLIAEGCSNAAIARRLFISPKTAAVHVSNILTKLGMASRAEVAAWAVRNDVGS